MSVKLLFPSVLVLTALICWTAHGQAPLDLPIIPDEVPSSSAPPGPAPGVTPARPTPTPVPYPFSRPAGPTGPGAATSPELIHSAPTSLESVWGSPSAVAAPASSGSAATATLPGTATPNDWLSYHRPLSCYCPIGSHGPVQLELYLRNGVAVPFGNSIYGRQLEPGWTFEGGVRSLFFQPDMRSAWVVDLGLVNSFNQTHQPEPLTASVLVPSGSSSARVIFGQKGLPGVTIHNINRTWANFGLGKMWYVTNPANVGGKKWRWGIDGGYRYGTQNVEFHELSHHSNNLYTAYTALYTDLEIPCGCCTAVCGLRTEYGYTWDSFLHQQSANIQDINILFNVGVRY